MLGAVRTKERCLKCQGAFKGQPLQCPNCLTFPRRFFVDFPWNGQRIKLYTGKDGHPLDSWERAYRMLTAMRNEIDLGKFDPKDYAPQEIKNLRFETYMQAWIERRTREQERRHISKSYLKKIQGYAKNYYLPFFQKISIRDIREAHIEDFRDQLPAQLSGKTVYNIMGVLHKLFQDAYRRRDILLMPTFPRIQVGEAVIKWITAEEQERILARVKEPVYRSYFLFLMHQGCRPAEGRALKWEDVKFRENTVIIRAAMDMDEYRPFTKERDVRYLPLHPEVREALGKLARSLSGYVFINRAGRPLSATRVRMHWQKAARAAGIDIGCYQGTKHSLGSQAINRGVSERLLAEFFGHRDLRSTRRYTKVQTETLKGVWDSSPKIVPISSLRGGSEEE
jgi:integrase